MIHPVIELTDVRKVYRMGETEVHALSGVSLSIRSGEFVSIMGPSGSGKSTLMNILGCLDRPTTGKYMLEGVDVSRMDRDERAEVRNEKIGFVFQSFHLLPRTSALENVELPMMYSNRKKMDAGFIRKHAMECLERVGLKGWENHAPSQLSGGQQQRVAIARALINDPSLILADEPTGNLDTKTSGQVMQVLESLNKEGKTIVLITHERDIAEHARRIVTLRDGVIRKDEMLSGEPGVIYQ